MNFKFTKMHALGNNYIYVDQFKEQLDGSSLSDLARQVSDVRRGIGADGLILIGPSDKADLYMRVFNADGSEAKNCGNGLRSVATYAYDHHLVDKPNFQIETLSGLYDVRIDYNSKNKAQIESVTINMGKPRLTKGALPMYGPAEESSVDCVLMIDAQQVLFTGVSIGNPHAIIFVDDIAAAPLQTLGPILEKHDWFPEGVNVGFVEIQNAQEVHYRVWERGSGQTFACGTGACAAVVAAVTKGLVNRAQQVTVHLQGGDLSIEWQEDGHILMTGFAEYVCKGTFYKKN